MVEIIINNVNTNNCSICFEEYQTPIKLHCLHIFCLKCITRAIYQVNHNCPLCRNPIQQSIINKLDNIRYFEQNNISNIYILYRYGRRSYERRGYEQYRYERYNIQLSDNRYSTDGDRLSSIQEDGEQDNETVEGYQNEQHIIDVNIQSNSTNMYYIITYNTNIIYYICVIIILAILLFALLYNN
jgi:hypothetical protein